MIGNEIPFLWLCGPPGVGKSAVGWEIFIQLQGVGIKTGYVDADQLGICYPAPNGDPDNHQIKAQNLGHVWSTFKAAGAQCLILSGSAISRECVETYVAQTCGIALTLCRLRADHNTLTERFLRRGWMPELVAEAIREAEVMDQGDFADFAVDTDGLTITEVAERVRKQADQWPNINRVAESLIEATYEHPVQSKGEKPTPVLWLCGPGGVGKSVVGWQVFTQIKQSGLKAAYLDLAQIGFCSPAPDDDPHNHQIKSQNLGPIWSVFQEAGAQYLVITGGVEHSDIIDIFVDLLPNAVLTVCRLRADREKLTERILARGRGEGPSIPGDALLGQPDAVLRQIADDAANEGAKLDQTEIGDFAVDTNGKSITEVAHEILAQIV